MRVAIKESTFKVPKMDCPSEEGLIRMVLEKSSSIKKLTFDLNARTVKVIHSDSPQLILTLLAPLKFGATEIGTRELEAGSLDIDEDLSAEDNGERKALMILLAVNGTMFIAELVFGLVAQSTGLIADSLDMLADALVYSISLLAVGKAVSSKRFAARISGWFQMILALGAFAEVIRRFFVGSEPLSGVMIGVSIAALIANVSCLWVIAKHRHGGVHMKASWIFSTNDVIANLGVIIAGLLVYSTQMNWPDLVVGSIISLVVFRGAIQILKISSRPKVSEVVA